MPGPPASARHCGQSGWQSPQAMQNHAVRIRVVRCRFVKEQNTLEYNLNLRREQNSLFMFHVLTTLNGGFSSCQWPAAWEDITHWYVHQQSTKSCSYSDPSWPSSIFLVICLWTSSSNENSRWYCGENVLSPAELLQHASSNQHDGRSCPRLRRR